MRTLLLTILTAAFVGRSASIPVTDRPDFARFFEAEKLNGSFLLYDLRKKTYTAYRFERSRQGFLPASTFKIPNTLIGLETGLLSDADAPMWKWDGVKRDIETWNRDQTVRSAFQASCVPAYRELARNVGLERMQTFVQKARYGRMDIHADNLDQFWLTGQSRISPVEEVDFLYRVYVGDVPFSERSRSILKKVMLLDEKPTHKLYGKTGWATQVDGVQTSSAEIGWFVGYVERGNEVYFFATNVESPAPVPNTFLPGRRRITEKILAELGVI